MNMYNAYIYKYIYIVSHRCVAFRMMMSFTWTAVWTPSVTWKLST